VLEFIEKNVEFLNLFTLIVSVVVIYRQLRAAIKSTKLESVILLHKKLNEISKLSDVLFSESLDFALVHTQFPHAPPTRHKIYKVPDYEAEKSELTPEQKDAFSKAGEQNMALADSVISKVNELGQLIEDGHIDYMSFLGIYHAQMIRLCSILEPYRRKIEKDKWFGGNYGHRLLRMRHKSILYQLAFPKHRCKQIYIRSNKKSIMVYPDAKVNKISCLYYRVKLVMYNY